MNRVSATVFTTSCLLSIILSTIFVVPLAAASCTTESEGRSNQSGADGIGMKEILRRVGCGIQVGASKIAHSVETGYTYIKTKFVQSNKDIVPVQNSGKFVNSSDDIVFEYDGNTVTTINDTITTTTTTTTSTPTTVDVVIDDRSLFDAPESCPKNQQKGRDGRCYNVVT